jgi:glycerophosphoryl diester phosphodiesterase
MARRRERGRYRATGMPPQWPFLDWPTPLAFAHRGGGGEQPENTLAAFDAAVKLGYRYLETDVHATTDGVLVCFHDDDLAPVSDRAGRISQLPYAEVRQARIQGEPIPLLAEVLAAFPHARLNIDAKHDECVPAVIEAIELARAHDRVCIGSFCERRANRLRRLTGGQVCTWMGRGQILRLRLSTLHRLIPGKFTPCAQVPMRQGLLPLVDPAFVRGAHARGVAVHVWTINDRAQMERLLDLNVDGIFSDRPTVLKNVLTERGQWTEPVTE